jgi:cation:H+ antiporter
MDFQTFIVLIVGLAFLTLGAEWLVRGASSVATRFGIAPIVIGLTVVAFGTSAPEFAVSVQGALTGNSDVAIGNVVGSNTFNILFVLGLSAVIGSLTIEQRIIKRDIPILLAISVVIYGLVWNELVGRIEGVVLFIGIVVYTLWLLRGARKAESATVTSEYEEAVQQVEGETVTRPLYFQIGLVVVGLALLIQGSRFLVSSATTIAEAFGVSDLVIGLTVVAVGTSLPELATSVMAAIRGQRDIAVGNVVGSNIFNLLAVLGASAAVSSSGISVNRELIRLDYPVMLAATLVLIPICWNGFAIKRWEGALLAAFYVAYVAFLVMDAGDSTTPELFRTMLMIVIPIVMLGFTATGIQGWRKYRATQSA